MASKKAGAALSDRGTGIEDILHCLDYATNDEYIQVDTRIYKTSTNAQAFDGFVRGVPNLVAQNVTTDAMLQFLLTEVDKLGTLPSQKLRAKNMFRAAFGAPTVAPGAPAPEGGDKAAKTKKAKKK